METPLLPLDDYEESFVQPNKRDDDIRFINSMDIKHGKSRNPTRQKEDKCSLDVYEQFLSMEYGEKRSLVVLESWNSAST